MGKYPAIDLIQPTIDRTKELLWPFDLTTWVKLAIIVFLAGASSGGGGQYFWNAGDFSGFGGSGEFSDADFNAFMDEVLTEEVLLVIGIALVLLLLLGVVFGYISDVFKFVFLNAVVYKNPGIIKPFKENMGRGLSLFLFKIVATIIFLIILAVMMVVAFFPMILGGAAAGTPGFLLGMTTFFLASIGFLVLGLAALVVFTLAGDFAIPLMSIKDFGVVKAMEHSLRLLRANVWQFILYFIVRMALGLAGGILILIVMIPVLLVLGLAALILAGVASLIGSILFKSIIGIALVIFVVLVGFFALLFIMAMITLPVPVFFRYYSLLFLMEMDPDFEKGI